MLRVAFTTAQPMHLPPRSAMGQREEGKPTPGNLTNCLLLLVPIMQNEQVVGLIEVFQGANRPAGAVPGFLQYMGLMADLAGRYQRNQLVGQLVGQQQVWTQLEAFARTIHGSLQHHGGGLPHRQRGPAAHRVRPRQRRRPPRRAEDQHRGRQRLPTWSRSGPTRSG